MTRPPNLIFKAIRQAQKAVERGDLEAAFKWTFIIDRQVEIIAHLAAIDDNDRRLKRYRPMLVGLRAAMMTIGKVKTSAKLAGGER